MYPKVSAKPKRSCKGVMLSVKLDASKHFSCVEQNKDIVNRLNLGSGKDENCSHIN